MFLYNLTLQPTTKETISCYGHFSGAKEHEIVVGMGRRLALLRPDPSGRVVTVLSTDVFGQIRALQAVRLTGQTKDFVVMSSDSGRVVVLQISDFGFSLVHAETYGKSGIRRIIPGQYLAADAKGRALLVGAVQQNKLVYILNRDAASELTLSSPLEAHRPGSVCWAVVGLDVGYENPVFAALEVEVDDPDTRGVKSLAFYELDLGLNHVVRKWSTPVDASANHLIAVPGDRDGPGGVLVCAENRVFFVNQDHPVREALLPRRADGSDAPLLVVASSTHKQKDMFFMLLQSELGDLYKLTIDYAKDNVSAIAVHYFDTIPVAADLAVMKSGFLFVALQDGGHQLYQFQSLGDDKPEAMYAGRNDDNAWLFEPREPTNMVLIHDSESIAPIVSCRTFDLAGEGAPQLVALGGRGPSAAVRVLRHGLAVEEVAVAPLQANPSRVWTVKKRAGDAFDAYLVVSFINATIVLSLADEHVSEVDDSGFLGTKPTLLAAIIGDDSFLQATASGLRLIRAGGRVQEWQAPGRKELQFAACNGQQCVVALTGGELYYFELDASGALQEVERKDLGKGLSCLDLAPLEKGSKRARFCAVGDWDNTVQVFSLDPDAMFTQVASQVVPAQAHSLAFVVSPGVPTAQLFLNIGLHNGVLLRTAVDGMSGALSDTRTRFCGTDPVTLHRVTVQGKPGVLVLSSRPWLSYSWQGRHEMTPLSYRMLSHGSSFASEQCPEGMVAVSENTVRIIAMERLGEMFNDTSVPVRYTPRKMSPHPYNEHELIVIQAEHHTQPYSMRAEEEESAQPSKRGRGKAAAAVFDAAAVQDHERALGRPMAAAGTWASCVQVLNAVTGESQHLLELEDNECAVSMAVVTFASRGEAMLVVGTAQNMQLVPRKAENAFLHVYALRTADGESALTLVHKTPVEAIPGALAELDGRLLAGVGSMLRIYELGKKRLLRKCENKDFPSQICHLDASLGGAHRIIVGDMAGSFLYAVFKRLENQLFVVADDPAPRWLTAACRVDYDTVAGADKFGNVFVVRLPPSASQSVDSDTGASAHRWLEGSLGGAAYKLDAVAQFHVGELVTSIEKTALTMGGSEVLLYTTIGGAVGALIPFLSKGDVDFFQHLETRLREEAPPLSGRNHFAYRSAFFPVKGAVDGDLCEQFLTLAPSKQKVVADALDRSVADVIAKIEGQRETRI